MEKCTEATEGEDQGGKEWVKEEGEVETLAEQQQRVKVSCHHGQWVPPTP